MKSKNKWSKILAIAVLIAMVASVGYAATPEQIEGSVADGVAWLADAQDDGDGHWGGDWEQAAQTCFALVKLQERAYDLGFDSPFDPDYEYAGNVETGWEYIFRNHTHKQEPLPVQNHGADADDPDTNANGYGVYFDTWGSQRNYTTGICLMALEASGTPARKNNGGLDFNGDTSFDSFQLLAQDAVDWMAFAQCDSGNGRGGWTYDAYDNGGDWSDQSNSGYSVLGLASGEAFGCTVPGWVRTELAIWIGYIQNADGGSDYDGGWGTSNELRTGNLLFQMCFNGDDQAGAPFQDALEWVEDNWQQANWDPGWGYNTNPADYQAMYCVMKALTYCGIDIIDTDGDGVRDNDWFNQDPPAAPPEDFASVLVAQQNGGGSWPGCNHGSDELCTVWALLTLEKIAPVFNEPPDCDDAYAKPGLLWPPNHKFNKIKVKGVTDPDGDDITITVTSIYQDELVDTYGDGKFTPDGKGVGKSKARVRAERSGTKKVPGDGRVYHIYFTADDGNDGTCTGEVTVGVPHDRKDIPVDGGPLYDSTATSP